MKYWLHPEAEVDLRDAGEFYREQAGVRLAQSLLGEFEHSIGLLLQHPLLGALLRNGKRRYVMRRFPSGRPWKRRATAACCRPCGWKRARARGATPSCGCRILRTPPASVP